VLTVAHGGRENLRFDAHYPDPQPKAGEVVIEVAATSVNYHDIFTRRGMPGVKIALPVIAGSDIAGTVRSVAPDVDRHWLGQRALIDPVFRGGPRVGMIGETTHGGRADLMVADASMLVPIPDGVAFEAAAALPLAYGTAFRMLVTRGQVTSGERVLILGASGGVGVACVQLAKLIGAEVVACTSSAAKAERLKDLGADHVVNYAERPFVDAVRDIYGKPRVTGSGGVDVAVNFTGGDTLLATQKCVKLGGRVLCCGATAGYDLKLDARYWWTFEQTLIGSDGWLKEDLAILLGLLESRQLSPVVDRVLRLEEVAEGERLLEEREALGKVVIRVQ
jgi:alcohol dehydrogenase